MILSRRTAIAGAAALPFAAARAADSADARKVEVTIDTSRTLATIAPDYVGLGFEISSVAVPGLLAASNKDYVKLVRNLGRDGVIRIGGNTADFSRYDAHGTAVSAPKATVVTEANLRELKTFIDAIGWKLIWGLNLGDDKMDNAVAQARAVSSIMGDRLLALEIGNEPDLFSRSGHRGADYNYDAWLKEYRRYKQAIRAVLPHAPFAGPDLAGATDWMERFARDDHDIALLTAHHYITGQANPAATIDAMLAANVKYDPVLARFQAASREAGKPWRMCETASFSGGGKEGVSDTFAAALWALDYLFVLAGHGCSGVNMETGVNHLGWISHYTPISDDLKGNYAKAPEYFGLEMFAQVPKGDIVAVDCQAGDMNITAHAVKTGNQVCLALINKDMKNGAEVTIRTGGMVGISHGGMVLNAPSMDAKSGITIDHGNERWPKNVSMHARLSAASAQLVWLDV